MNAPSATSLLGSREGTSRAETLNRDCHCITLDRPRLHGLLARELEREVREDPELSTDNLWEQRPYLFASLPLFVDVGQLAQTQSVVEAVEHVVRSPGYRKAVLGDSPPLAHESPGPTGVLYSFDFHLTPAGPRLIEINTNAGGLLLHLFSQRAQHYHPPCSPTERREPTPETTELALLEMFQTEWRRFDAQGRPLTTVAIVDDDPEAQFLFPEMLLYRNLLRRHGIDCWVADAKKLEHRNGCLWLGDKRIDLVYNRLTDFYFERREHLALRQAYEARSAAITPHPHGHALYAHKRNLALLSDPDTLRHWDVEEATVDLLSAAVPRTVLVRGEDAESLWANRRHLFFKPLAGHGSRGAYRGSKVTRRVFRSILEADYVAQESVLPSARAVEPGQEGGPYKSDLRCFVYDGKIFAFGARLYRGQTTNFRTEGSGLASVLAA